MASRLAAPSGWARCPATSQSKSRRYSSCTNSLPGAILTKYKEVLMTTKPIPDGYHTVTPYLMMNDCAKAIDFYKKAFGATELVRMPMPDGRIGHAEIKIGDSPIMMADDCPQATAHSPK